MCMCVYIYIYTYGRFPDRIRKWLWSRKLKNTYPTVRTNIGVTPNKTYPLACVLRRGMLKGMLTPCVRIASEPPCFYCSLPSAWKGGLCPSWVPGLCFRVCFGYAFLRRYSYALCG